MPKTRARSLPLRKRGNGIARDPFERWHSRRSSPKQAPSSGAYSRRKDMAITRPVSAEEARDVGSTLKIDWTKVDLEQFRHGLEVEFEHGARDPETNVTNDDLVLTGRIA